MKLPNFSKVKSLLESLSTVTDCGILSASCRFGEPCTKDHSQNCCYHCTELPECTDACLRAKLESDTATPHEQNLIRIYKLEKCNYATPLPAPAFAANEN